MASNSSSSQQITSNMSGEGRAVDDGTVTRTATQLHYADNNGKKFEPELGSFYFKSNEGVQIAIINLGRNKVNVSGNVNTSELKGNVNMYEVVFVVMLKNNLITRWDVQMKLKVKLPDGSNMEPLKQKRTEILVTKPRQQWVEILAGEFKTISNMNSGIINFSVDIEPFQVQENALVIKSVIFRPVSTPLDPKPIRTTEINVRELSIYRGQLKDHWTWDVIQDGRTSSNTFLEVVQLVDIGWLEVRGTYDTSNLTKDANTRYEVVFYIRLKNDAQGWVNNQVTARINGQITSQQIIDESYQTEEFHELVLGDITFHQGTTADKIEFSLSETTSGLSKKGLVIKRVLLRAKYH